MKLTKLLVASLMVTTLFTACESNKKTARNGLEYTLVREGSGKASQQGDYLIINMSYRDKATDSVWVDTGDSSPQAFPQNDSLWMSETKDIQVIFAEMKEGDSVTFDVTVNDFFTNTVKNAVPPGLDPEAIIQFNIGLQHVFNQDEAMAWAQENMDKQRAKAEAEAEVQFEKDAEQIENYLTENNITTNRTDSGVYYEILENGSGEQATNGATVKVNYTGRLLSGEYFDSSYEDVAKENNAFSEGRPYGPYEFTLGQGAVIKGWDDAIVLLKEGAKARLFVPSTLAYGPQRRSQVIGPNSILVFDIELVEVN